MMELLKRQSVCVNNLISYLYSGVHLLTTETLHCSHCHGNTMQYVTAENKLSSRIPFVKRPKSATAYLATVLDINY